MRITNPQGAYNGIAPENVFIALDDMGTQVGIGYLIYQYLPHRSPECPVNIYFDINSLPSGWYLILGALVARARVLREQVPSQPARLYTRLTPDQGALLAQYRESGFDCTQKEVLFQLFKPADEGRIPMSCAIRQTPLNTPQEQQQLVDRLMRNDITHVTLPYLQQQMRMQHFMALGLIQDRSLVGEVILAGSGVSCEVIAVYTDPVFRKHGMGKLLLQRSMAVMAAEGVNIFGGMFVTLSEPQRHLIADFNGNEHQLLGLFPQLML